MASLSKAVTDGELLTVDDLKTMLHRDYRENKNEKLKQISKMFKKLMPTLTYVDINELLIKYRQLENDRDTKNRQLALVDEKSRLYPLTKPDKYQKAIEKIILRKINVFAPLAIGASQYVKRYDKEHPMKYTFNIEIRSHNLGEGEEE